MIAGTVNGASSVLVVAARVGEDLLLNRIIDMIKQARQAPSRSERIAERLAARFIPAVLVFAAGAGLCWLLADGVRQAGFVVLAILAVTCPCAMGLATPLATALAIARAARAGILVRGGDALERIGEVRTIFFDKTSTVTRGRMSLERLESVDPGTSGGEVLAHLAALESGSEHALARSILAEAKARGLAIGIASAVQVLPGQGLRGKVALDGRTRDVAAGTEEFVRAASQGPAAPRVHSWPVAGNWPGPASDSATAVYVAWDGKIRGRAILSDSPRPDAAEAVRQLHEAGISTVLLSGDRVEAARAIARAVGIGAVEAPRRPDEKIAAIRAAAAGRRGVAMVGDGINDAPALAAADVGIALGAGTDLARQAGHVVLLSDRLVQIPWLIALGRRTRRIIRQNLLWAFGYNTVALGAAALGWLHPLLAATAMIVSSLTVLGNSLRLQAEPTEAQGSKSQVQGRRQRPKARRAAGGAVVVTFHLEP